MQQLARWLELEQAGNQDPRVRLANYGSISTNTTYNVTYVTPFGALVQMFDPFKLTDAKKVTFDLYIVGSLLMHLRIASILGITREDVHKLIAYVSQLDIDLNRIIKALRTLK